MEDKLNQEVERIIESLEQSQAEKNKEQDDLMQKLGEMMKTVVGKVQKLTSDKSEQDKQDREDRQKGGGNDDKDSDSDAVAEVFGYAGFVLAFIIGMFLKNQYRLLQQKFYQVLFQILLCLLSPSFISNQHGFFFWFLTIIYLMLNP